MNKFQQLSFDSPRGKRMMGVMPTKTTIETEMRPSQSRPATNGAVKAPPHQTAPFPLDRQRGFALAAHQRVNGALLKCEERFPLTGHHSVLYVVVKENAAHARQELARLHEEYFDPEEQDPLAPVRLQVVDFDADTAVQRMVEAGLLYPTVRSTRPLWPANTADNAIRLTAAEEQKLARFKQHAARKVRIAEALTQAGLPEEAHPALLDAILALGRSLALGQRLPEPEVACESLLPPYASMWGKNLQLFRRFAADSEAPCEPVLQGLKELLV